MVMAKKPPYSLVYADAVVDHLEAIEAKNHTAIFAAIESQLLYEPDVQTRNRKPLERPVEFGATWELRCGPQNRFRVFYAIEPNDQTVRIVAIGVKDRSRLFLGGAEFKQ